MAIPIQESCLSPVFCCYQLVYDISNMSRLEVILRVRGLLRVRGRDGTSTQQNGVAVYSQSHISHFKSHVIS